MANIKVVMFNNGLQIVGELIETKKEEGKLVISKPCQLVMVPQKTKETELGLGLVPFMQYTEEWTRGVTFSVTDVLTVLSPIVDITNHYNTLHGSGIVQPNSGLNLPGIK